MTYEIILFYAIFKLNHNHIFLCYFAENTINDWYLFSFIFDFMAQAAYLNSILADFYLTHYDFTRFLRCYFTNLDFLHCCYFRRLPNLNPKLPVLFSNIRSNFWPF
jgi:hypothetical protein